VVVLGLYGSYVSKFRSGQIGKNPHHLVEKTVDWCHLLVLVDEADSTLGQNLVTNI